MFISLCEIQSSSDATKYKYKCHLYCVAYNLTDGALQSHGERKKSSAERKNKLLKIKIVQKRFKISFKSLRGVRMTFSSACRTFQARAAATEKAQIQPGLIQISVELSPCRREYVTRRARQSCSISHYLTQTSWVFLWTIDTRTFHSWHSRGHNNSYSALNEVPGMTLNYTHTEWCIVAEMRLYNV